MRFSQTHILSILFFLLSHIASASKPYTPVIENPILEPWQWTDYNQLDTLGVRCLSKSQKGDLWLGIGNRAVRFDGYKLHYNEIDSSQLVSMVHERSDNLLIATAKGIYRYSENKFTPILKLKFSINDSFLTDSNGYIWISSKHGLLKITPWHIRCFNPHGTFELDVNGRIKNKIASFTEKGNSLKNIQDIIFPVYRFDIDEEDVFWATCNYENNAFVKIENLQNIFIQSKWQFYKVPNFAGSQISGICRVKDELILTFGDPDLSMIKVDLNTGKQSEVNFNSLGGDDQHTGMVQTSDGKIWISGHSKVYTYDGDQWRIYQYPEVKLPLSNIFTFKDNNDHLYFSGTAMFRKLEYINGSYTTYIGLNFHCNTPDGAYWFTTNDGRVVKGDSTLSTFESYDTSDGLIDKSTLVYYSQKGELWATGSHRDRAAVAVFDGKKWKKRRFPNFHHGISYNGIKELGDTSIVFTANGILSFDVKNSGGIIEYYYPEKKWRFNFAGKVPVRIPSVDQTSDGKLLFSGNTFGVFDGSQTTNIDHIFSGNNWTDDIKVTPDDHIWVAQGGVGLFYYDGTNWKRYGERNGLASNMVTYLCYENDSSIFIGTDNGISFFDGKQFVNHIMNPGIGVAREKGSIKVSADHSIWVNQGIREWYLFGMKNTRITPAETFKTILYKRDKNGPFTSITFAEKEIPPLGNVLIRYEGRDYMNKTAPKNLEFSYRLNGGPWSLFTTEKSAMLLDLEDGKYIFEVRSRDMDLNIDKVPASVSFIVQPPVHKRAWFILTILTFLFIISYLLIRLYMRNKEIHELDQFKLRLFTDISHELKTPLTLIMLPLQKLMQKETGGENKKYIDLIYGNVERLSNLVTQVIDFRRLESKNIQLELAPADFIQQLNSIYHYYKPLADDKGFQFTLETNINELWLSYDADKIEKIIVNLLSNAFKYTPENGNVVLKVNWNDLKQRLEIIVSDNGPGIPVDLQKSIFNRFYRMKENGLNKVPGSGIGLSLVKELVGLHNGNIEVFSDGINGTEFKVVLPMQKAERQIGFKIPEPEMQLEDIGGEKPLLLLVEDEEQMLQFVAGEMTEYFDVLKATTAEKGIKYLKKMPDLIISDVMLPGMNGVDFCKSIKENEETSHIPVILLTARDTEENIVEGIRMGADDYITKPFNMAELKARSLGLIENRKRLRRQFAEHKNLQAEQFTSNQSDQKFLNKAIEAVYQHLDNPDFDVKMFCQLTNVSKTLLYSKLKALTGQSATEFVRNIRLKEAHNKLIDSANQQTVAEISYTVGFNDPLYFSRCFKKYFGIPPSEVTKSK